MKGVFEEIAAKFVTASPKLQSSERSTPWISLDHWEHPLLLKMNPGPTPPAFSIFISSFFSCLLHFFQKLLFPCPSLNVCGSHLSSLTTFFLPLALGHIAQDKIFFSNPLQI